MVYRSLLVHLDDDERCALRVQLSIELARRFGAHLVGLAPTGVSPLTAYAALGAVDGRMLALAEDSLREVADRHVARFGAACAAAGLPSHEAVVDIGESGESLVRHGRCSDLLVIAQPDRDRPGYLSAIERTGRVVLQAARPTLVVPQAGRFDTVGERVLVAWNGGREAARALADALPMLAHAREVQVLQLGRPGDPALDSAARLEALRRWLAWHGVEATVRIEHSEIDPADLLLSRAADTGADLIVMGAYGHARWTERVLGGATRSLLAQMTVPLLMSH